MKVEQFFETMVSNTLAGSSNQAVFLPEKEDEVYVGRVLYKVFSGGEYPYSFLFSGATDSSFPIENITPADYPVTGWEIVYARIGKCKNCDMQYVPEIADFTPLTFDGKKSFKVEKPELFCSDAVRFSAEKGEYICLEIAYKGKEIPHHFENSIPAFLKVGDEWVADNRAVFANMVGCDRKVEKKVAYLGDSVTQGLGAGNNEYKHWSALVSEMLGEQYAYWNLGIGFGMANDCAKDKIWLEKARKNDTVVVCFGINDMCRVKDAQRTKQDIITIIRELKKCGIRVILQTLPPFNFQAKSLETWKELNRFIKTEMDGVADRIFDMSPVLTQDLPEGYTKFEGHPNQEGSRLWAESFYSVLKEEIEKT